MESTTERGTGEDEEESGGGKGDPESGLARGGGGTRGGLSLDTNDNRTGPESGRTAADGDVRSEKATGTLNLWMSGHDQ